MTGRSGIALVALLASIACGSPARSQDASTLKKDMVGQWELSTTERSKTCVVTLRSDSTPQGLKLELEPVAQLEVGAPDVPGERVPATLLVRGARVVENTGQSFRSFMKYGFDGEQATLDHERTARNAGWLDVQLRPERRNRVKVLLFLDVGGSMDPHIQVCEELFSAAKSEFRHLEYFYFHNCVYDHVWRDNARRRNERG